MIKPKEDTKALVHEWLEDNQVGARRLSYSPAGDWITVSLPVEDVETLLQTNYSVYKHEDGTHLIRTLDWSLPIHLHSHIEAIQPTNSFLRALPQVQIRRDDNSTNQAAAAALAKSAPPPSDDTVQSVCGDLNRITLDCLRTFYGTKSYVPQAAGKNQVGMTAFLNEISNRSDVGVFLKRYRPEAADEAKQFTIVSIAGGDTQQTPDTPEQLAHYKDVEANLDAEMITGFDYPTPLTVWSTAGQPPFIPDRHDPQNNNEPYLVWQNYLLQQENLPQVISNSYADDEQTLPKSYAQTVCNQFAQFGARGITFLSGSGDFGVGKDNTCFSNDGKNTSMFLPAFPVSCPYVTAVGATKNFDPEVVAFDANPPKPNPKNYASGAGFSNYFDRPLYQALAVPPYVNSLGNKYAGLYNKNGRAYPDLAAQGQRVAFIWNGTDIILDGTSVSTPLVAGILTLVNDALIAKGKSPLGFLNPWLYTIGHLALTDVTSGSTPGCNVDGFPAAKGWDVASGWGTPVSLGLFTVANTSLTSNDSISPNSRTWHWQRVP